MEPVYFRPHLKELLFLKPARIKKIVIRSADAFPSLSNKEKIKSFFEDNSQEYNIVRLCLIPDEERNEKNLNKNFPWYAGQIIKHINNCQGILFHVRGFTNSQWLKPDGFSMIKEKYPNIFLLLDINSTVLEEINYKADVLAEKVFIYREYIDAVALNLDPKNFKDVIAMEGFKKETIKFLKSFQKKLH